MARGRMLNKSVSASVKFQNLPDDTCRLMATWIVSHLDKNGVFYGDPMMVKSLVFPRRSDITLEQVELYLERMKEVGLIQTFVADNQVWQYWPGFQDNQIGLRADRESTSRGGFIYIIRSEGGEYKVGRTKNISKRLNFFGVKLPFEIELIHAFPASDTCKAEQAIHKGYSRQRLNGEWFRLSDEDILELKKIIGFNLDEGFLFEATEKGR